MSAGVFSIGGKKFDSLDVIGATLTRSTSGQETLTLELDRAIDAAAVFNPFSKQELREDNTLIWTGWLNMEPIAANGQAETKSLTFLGAWRFLDLVEYEQLIPVKGEEGPQLASSSAVMVGRLFSDAATPAGRIDADDILAEIASQLQAKSPASLGGGLPELFIPLENRSDSTLGSVLLSVMAWFPTRVVQAGTGAGLAIVDVDATTQHIFDESDIDIESLRIVPRYDLLCSETKIVFLRQQEGELFARTEDVSTTGNGSPRKIFRTVELEKGEDAPAEGLAAQFQSWAGRLLLDSELTLPDLRFDILAGDRAWFRGALPTFGTDGRQVIQTVTFDLMAETTTLALGPRHHLGLDQLLALARKPAKGAGDPPQNQPTNTGTITVTILDASTTPTAVEGAVYVIDGEQFDNGAAATLEPGDYDVTFLVPPEDYFTPAPITVTVTEGGAAVEAVTAPFRKPHSWRCIVAGAKAIVCDGEVYNGLNSTAAIEIGGSPGLNAWHDVAAGDKFILHGYFSDGELDHIDLERVSEVTEVISTTTGTSPKQTDFRCELAEIAEVRTGVFSARHKAPHNFRLLWQPGVSIPVLYPFPLS